MPTLEWIGKEKVVNHHRDVPYCVLERKYSFDSAGQHEEDNGSENMIIHGDNLYALKSLLPKYEGKIKCIYIDPPYNTGNEGWVYNDNVNSPQIKKWLGEVVGKEGEDLSRHDKWLCMMYPRLQLLKKLLSEDGGIFISIDDNEQSNLRQICNEIFGEQNFIANIVWQKRTSPDARINLGPAHDYVICYANKKDLFKSTLNKISPSNERSKSYKNPDNDPRGPWASVDLTGQVGHATDNQYYKIELPDGRLVSPPRGRCWAISEANFKELIRDNRIWIGKKNSVPRKKKFLSESDGVTVWTWWTNDEVGHNQEATKELIQIIDDVELFNTTPKPTRLIQRIVELSTNSDSIILDSFAGTNTTAHAVLKLNNIKGSNRKFISIEMMDYADTLTTERVKKVIQGYENTPGINGSFSFYELGEQLLTDDHLLNEDVGIDKIREYIFYTETNKPLVKTNSDNKSFIGFNDTTAYYFHYDKNKSTILDDSFLSILEKGYENHVIYADTCTLPVSIRKKFGIVFKKIPRDIERL